MRLNFKSGIASVAIAASCSTAMAADLLGDTLSFMRAYPNTSTRYGAAIANTTVAVGTTDQVGWNLTGVAPFFVLINPEPDHIIFTFPVINGMGSGGSLFDGYVITGFDSDIASVSVANNTTGQSVLASAGLRQIDVALSGTFPANQSFALAVSLVPEPASAVLLALGIGALLLRSRRTEAAQGA